MEPRASTPALRLRAIEALTQAGVPAGVLAAPMIPGLNDAEMEAIIEAAHRAGARSAGYVLLRLPLELREMFTAWLQEHVPDRARRVLALIRETRAGALTTAAFMTVSRAAVPTPTCSTDGSAAFAASSRWKSAPPSTPPNSAHRLRKSRSCRCSDHPPEALTRGQKLRSRCGHHCRGGLETLTQSLPSPARNSRPPARRAWWSPITRSRRGPAREMLLAGGNAVDAAVAALFVLTVVEPMMVGIAGGGLAHIRLADGTHTVLDGLSTGAAAARPRHVSNGVRRAARLPGNRGPGELSRPLAVAVPGALAGWCAALERFGTVALEDALPLRSPSPNAASSPRRT